MSFGSAFYIPKEETRKYADGSIVEHMTDEFKKYQLLRTGALFGLYITPNTKNPNKIMMTDGKNVTICIDGNRIPDHLFAYYMMQLKESYNSTRRYALAGTSLKMYESKKYETFMPTLQTTAEDSYQENYDQVTYMEKLIKDLERSGKVKKADAIKQNMQTQITSAINFSKNTTWGKTISQSLGKFWENNSESVLRNLAERGE